MHVTSSPLPMLKTTWSGVAVVVTLTFPADADALTGCHWLRSIHSHVSTLVTAPWSEDGFMLMPGRGIGASLRACCASCWGSTRCGAHTIVADDRPFAS